MCFSLQGALSTIGICKEDQEHIFEMLAAVLWLGNITFCVTDTENHIEVIADEGIYLFASASCPLRTCSLHVISPFSKVPSISCIG